MDKLKRLFRNNYYSLSKKFHTVYIFKLVFIKNNRKGNDNMLKQCVYTILLGIIFIVSGCSTHMYPNHHQKTHLQIQTKKNLKKAGQTTSRLLEQAGHIIQSTTSKIIKGTGPFLKNASTKLQYDAQHFRHKVDKALKQREDPYRSTSWSSQRMQIIDLDSGQCISRLDNILSIVNTIAVTHPCKEKGYQQFAWDGSVLRSHQQCLTVHSGNLREGEGIGLKNCIGGRGQDWVLEPQTRRIRLINTELCLDVQRTRYTDPRLIISFCRNKNTARWITKRVSDSF